MLRRFFALVAAVSLLLAMAVACSSTDAISVVAPITGVIIRAESLTAGLGCGTSAPQVYKYVALAYGYDGRTDAGDFDGAFTQPVAASVFDCFSDGTFVQLPQTNGSFRYRIELYIYVEPAYQRARSVVDPISVATVTPVFDPALKGRLLATNPTWTTQCTATQQDLVEVLAICDPFTANEAGGASVIQIPTGAFARADGGSIGCGTTDGGVIAPTDAGDAGDASDDAAGDAEAGVDAGDASVIDAGAPAPTYSKVRVRARIGQEVVGSTVDVACPQAFLLSPASALTSYTFDVGLIDDTGKTTGSTTCSGAAEPGSVATATCAPVP